ncbi:MAG: nitrilase-related carbon-nitrogen hydrolase, partial [Propionibacteriaceae bacterium]|nr:nitrilase-related carbon-nitrogen hydrolase [Propionibacteriaceae bacterium]
MARRITVSTVAGYPIVAPGLSVEQSLDLIRERWAERLAIVWPDQPDLVVLPEHGDRPIWSLDPYQNIPIEMAAELTAAKGDTMVSFYGDLAREHRTHIAYSGYRIDAWGHLRNSTQIIGPEGTVLGIYDKVHLTIPEHHDRDVVPGAGMKVV